MDEELDSQIKKNAAGPKSASDEVGSVEQHPLPHQIAADRYLSSKKAMKKGRGFRLAASRVRP
jgi:hypothetical protein